MEIHEYDIAFLLKKYANNVTQYGGKQKYNRHGDIFIISSHTTKLRIYCLLTMFVDVGS